MILLTNFRKNYAAISQSLKQQSTKIHNKRDAYFQYTGVTIIRCQLNNRDEVYQFDIYWLVFQY